MRLLLACLILSPLVACKPSLTGEALETSSPANLTADEAPAGEAVLDEKFGCRSREDCTSTCDSGCVNVSWARGHRDTCVNIRAWDCTCVENTCYTDGKAPR